MEGAIFSHLGRSSLPLYHQTKQDLIADLEGPNETLLRDGSVVILGVHGTGVVQYGYLTAHKWKDRRFHIWKDR